MRDRYFKRKERKRKTDKVKRHREIESREGRGKERNSRTEKEKRIREIERQSMNKND